MFLQLLNASSSDPKNYTQMERQPFFSIDIQ